jgi:hypothetical protein
MQKFMDALEGYQALEENQISLNNGIMNLCQK